MTTRWSDELLDGMRLVADEPADRAVRALYEARPDSVRWRSIHAALDALVSNDSTLPSDLPRDLTDYLQSTSALAELDAEVVAGGEAFFATHGPEVLILLACYSLPVCYGDAKGVQVLCRTEFLEEAARLRLFQTAQWIVDVLSPGGLAPKGKGIRAVQKVRLFHAAIRHLLLTDGGDPWDAPALGLPINQEDLAFTLMTFSHIVLDGLARLDIEVPADEQQAFLDVWRAVGSLMGIENVLIPADPREASLLTATIQRRQMAASTCGVRLTSALVGAMREGAFVRAPEPVGQSAGSPPAPAGPAHHSMEEIGPILMRHLMADQRDPQGRRLADLLEVPPVPRLEEGLLDVALRLVGRADHALDATAGRRVALRAFNLRFIDWMLTRQLGPGRALFSVPPTLYSSWQHPPAV